MTPETPDAGPQPTLRLTDVHKAYGDNAVLRGVSLDIDEHEVVDDDMAGQGDFLRIRDSRQLEDQRIVADLRESHSAGISYCHSFPG